MMNEKATARSNARHRDDTRHGPDRRTGPLSREISSPYRRNKLRGILRQVDQSKVSFGVEMVLARLIDDSEIVAPGSCLIRDHLVDLARLEIRLRVRDAQRKTPS